MNNEIKKVGLTDAISAQPAKMVVVPMLLGIVALGVASSALAVDECGPGPVVVCNAAQPGGVTYNFASDLSFTMSSTLLNLNVGANGLRLNGTGDADLNFVANKTIFGTGGVLINLENGDVNAEIMANIANAASTITSHTGTGMHISTGGAANVRMFGNTGPGTATFRLSNLVLDVGSDSSVDLEYRRTLSRMTLSPRAGATVTVNVRGGVLGDDALTVISNDTRIMGSGAGHLILNNAVPRSRISSRMDFTGMTGRLTILNDFSGNPQQGGWHTRGASYFGAGTVDIRNGQYGVLRTASETSLDFSDTADARFFNQGRVMVGAADNATFSHVHHLSFIGLDRFENSGLVLLGTAFGAKENPGDVTDGTAGERLTFEDSHYVGTDGGRIAFDALLGLTPQADCTTAAVADCVRFVGSSTTEGTTLLNIRDVNPVRAVAGFNPGIVLVEGASAAEHFKLDPSTQFYVGHTSGGEALQKGMIAYRLEYDAAERQHALVGTLADEAVQAATLGGAAHEIWRTSTDTWFDRQAMARVQGEAGVRPQGLWSALNMARADRSVNRTIAVGGNDTAFNLAQDQDVSHLAFGLDVLRGSSGRQSWNGGVTVGLLHSSVDYEATQTQAKMTGLASGLYGSWALGGLTVDGMFNLNFMRQSFDGSNFGLGEHNRLRTQVKSNGGRLEAAWMLPMGKSFWLQPLLGASLVNTSEGDITLPDDAGGVRFGNDDRSMRVGAGLRMGVDSRIAGMRAQYRLTGRYWDEQEAENTVEVDVANETAPLQLVDAFNGNFSELDGGLFLSNEAGSLSGFVSMKGKFGDDYSSVGGSAGLRYQW